MSRTTPIQTNFTGGEISPRLYGRVDLQKYATSVERCENFIIFSHGGITKRSGTRFITEVKFSDRKVKLIPFIFSTEQAYILEFGHYYIRFYRNESVLLNGAGTAPYEVVSPFSEDDLDDLDFTQSADVLYLVHKDYQPRTLNRLGPTNWSLDLYLYKDGPYNDVNTGTVTVYPSALTGTATVTASSGIFASTDVGRWFRFKNGSPAVYGAAVITGYTNSTTVTVVIEADFPFGAAGSGNATKEWRFGAWSNTLGWPTSVAFFQERLFFAASPAKPATIWSTRTADFTSFSPSNAKAEVLDDSALNLTLSTDQVNAIRWIYGEKRLQLGTSDGPFILSAGRNYEALTPTNATISRETTDGTANERPVGASRTTLYIDRSRLKVRELSYDINIDGYTSIDLTLLAEHITTGNVKQIAYARSPDNLVWTLLQTGELRCLSYEPDQEVVAWHRHIIGGTSVQVKQIAVVPKNDESEEVLYLVVQRTINGQTVQYVEYLERSFDTAKGMVVEDAFFIDSGISYDGSPVSVLSGLDHLEGETVQILADGAVHPDRLVVSGSITLARTASKVSVGLPFVARVRTLDPEVQTQTGPSQGKIRRIERVTFRLVDTFNLKFGANGAALEIIPFRSGAMPMGSIRLFTGDKRVLVQHPPERQFELLVQSDTPHPCTVLAIMYAMTVSER
jgi:hypothetical protein